MRSSARDEHEEVASVDIKARRLDASGESIEPSSHVNGFGREEDALVSRRVHEATTARKSSAVQPAGGRATSPR